MLKKTLLTLLGISSNLLISGCTINPPNIPVCTEIRPDKAFCTYTIEDKEFIWDDTNKYKEKTYWEARPTMILMPASSYADLKAFVIKACKQSGQCTDQDIASWDRKVKKLEEKK